MKAMAVIFDANAADEIDLKTRIEAADALGQVATRGSKKITG